MPSRSPRLQCIRQGYCHNHIPFQHLSSPPFPMAHHPVHPAHPASSHSPQDYSVLVSKIHITFHITRTLTGNTAHQYSLISDVGNTACAPPSYMHWIISKSRHTLSSHKPNHMFRHTQDLRRYSFYVFIIIASVFSIKTRCILPVSAV